MTRPITLVYQELQTVTPQAVDPDLDCLVLASAYQILDYEDDKQNIEVAAYGALNANNPVVTPVVNTPAITVAAPPGIAAGGWVDPASVRVHFDDFRVILAQGAGGVTSVSTNTLTVAGATFITDGVQPGDTLIVDNPAGPATPNLIRTVRTVVSETVITVSTNFVAASASLNYRIERTLQDTQISSAFVTPPTFRSSNEIVIRGGVTVAVNNIPRVVSYARVYVSYRAYRTDLQGMDSISPNTAVSDIETKIGKIDARNPLAALVWVASQNAGQAPIYFYGVETDDLLGYTRARDAISSEKRVYATVVGNPSLAINAMFRADNITLADPTLALASGVPQKFRVSLGSAPLATTEEVVVASGAGTTQQRAGAIPPGDRTVTMTGATFQANGVRPGDVFTITSALASGLDGAHTISHINSPTSLELDTALPATGVQGLNYTITRPSTGATIVALQDTRGFLLRAGVTYRARYAGSGAQRDAITIALVQNSTTAASIQSITDNGTALIINGDFTSNAITAAMVAAAVNTGAGVVVPFAGSAWVIAIATTPVTVQAAAAAAAISTGTPGANNATLAPLDAVFIRLFNPAGSFVTDGVIPGDILEMPRDPNTAPTVPTAFTAAGTKRYVVNEVISEQLLEIQNIVAGAYVNNSGSVEAELPHLDNRFGTQLNVTQGTMAYRINRELTRDQQVDSLVAMAQSLRSQRALLQWPDSVEVAGLTDGSLPRNADGSAAAAGPQSGVYLSAVVGGMTAGLPNHQGFSRLGCAGISRLYHSQGYFTEAQLTSISDGGWYVFVQDTPESLPYCIHQLTTDPGALQTGEYSMVKNFDYLSKFFVTILDRFVGTWNVNEETIGFMRQALNSGISQLKLKRVARIGAPIIDAAVASLQVSTASPDRVEIFMNVDRPTPLNVIGLHLIG